MSFKKIISKVLVFVFLLNMILPDAFCNENVGEILASSYILMDVNSGQVLCEQGADEKRAVASLNKIMIMLLTAESVDNKEISLDDMVTVTERATQKKAKESLLWLEVGEKMSVKNLLKAVAIASANDAARMLGEFLSGVDENSAVELMNKRAKELGMRNTNFVNVAGLDDNDQYSSARDVAIMGRELVLKHPWITKFTSKQEDKIDRRFKDKDFTTPLYNTNRFLLREFRGLNGLKTGTEDQAGRCLCATAKRGDMSLLTVCLNCKTLKDRDYACKNLLEFGFKNFVPLKSDKTNDVLKKQVSVVNGKKQTVDVMLGNSDYKPLVNRKNSKKVTINVDIKQEIKAPIKKGDVLGKVVYFVQEKPIWNQDILAKYDVDKIDWAYLFFSMIKSFFFCSNIYS